MAVQTDLVTVSTVLVEVMVTDEPLGQISIISIMTTISTPMYSPQRSVVVDEDDTGRADEETWYDDDDDEGGAVVVSLAVVLQDVDRLLEAVLEMEPDEEMLDDVGRTDVVAELLRLDDDGDALEE